MTVVDRSEINGKQLNASMTKNTTSSQQTPGWLFHVQPKSDGLIASSWMWYETSYMHNVNSQCEIRIQVYVGWGVIVKGKFSSSCIQGFKICWELCKLVSQKKKKKTERQTTAYNIAYIVTDNG